MENSKAKIVRYILLLLVIVELYAEFVHDRGLMFFTKPFVLPLIAVYYFLSVNGTWSKLHKLMMFAFLFSWFGDVSLMLTPETPADTSLMGIPKSPYCFLAGLGSFLVTQILFISAFRRAVSVSGGSGILFSKLYYVPFLIYWVSILCIVLPPLQHNAEKQIVTVPVIVYAAVLISMAATAFSRRGKTNSQSFWLTFAGACIFVISDSLIALNFLALPQPGFYAGFSIMSTYVIAEYLIAEGVLSHENSSFAVN